MSDTTCHMSISLDGFVAGPDQSRENPLGMRGGELHGWHMRDPLPTEADRIANRWLTDGFDVAYSQALETAGGNGVDIAGGASTVWQALGAGVIDELTLDIAPVLLGSGERILEGVETFDFEPVEVLHSPLATHIRYRRRSAG